jgi:hypothetical protein
MSEYDEPGPGAREESVRCPSGHSVPSTQQYCGTCGLRVGNQFRGASSYSVVGSPSRARWPLLVVPLVLVLLLGAGSVLALRANSSLSIFARDQALASTTTIEVQTLTGELNVGNEADVVGHLFKKLEGEGYSAAQTLSAYSTMMHDGVLEIPEEYATCADGLQDSGYSDVSAGSSVRVVDESGTIVGMSSLTGGELNQSGCKFSFSVELPRARFYEIQVGRREGLRTSYEELVSQGWAIEGSLGD